MPLHSYTISNTTPNGDRALSVMVREFDANLMTENEMRKHFSQVGSVDRISIITREGWGRHHAFVDFFTKQAANRAVKELDRSYLTTASKVVFQLRVWHRGPHVEGPRICGKRTDPVIRRIQEEPADVAKPPVEMKPAPPPLQNAWNRPRAAAVAAGMAAARLQAEADSEALAAAAASEEAATARKTVDAMQSWASADAAAAPQAKDLNAALADLSLLDPSLASDVHAAVSAQGDPRELHGPLPEFFSAAPTELASTASSESGASTPFSAWGEPLAAWGGDDTWRMPSNIVFWSAHDVSAFCKAIGLPDKIYNALLENLVDGRMLARLTDNDLVNEIGMKPLQIKRLRRELSELFC